MKTYSFEKLNVWQEARILAQEIYRGTSNFPPEEKFGLVMQLRKSAVSVCSNIAEGTSRQSKRDQSRFYEIAYGSLMELLNQCIISSDLGFTDQKQIVEFRDVIDRVAFKLSGLRRAAQ